MKSFDRVIDPLVGDRGPYWICANERNHPGANVIGRRVRVVPWPGGAPDPSDVPQAGERRWWGPENTEVTVANGVPYRTHTGTWCVGVFIKDSTYPQTAAVNSLRTLVPEPEVTKHTKLYSADQIEEAMVATSYGSAAALIKRMDHE